MIPAPSQTPNARHQATWRAVHPKPPPEPLPSTDEPTMAALTAAKGNRRAAARALGISSSTMLRRLKAEPLASWAALNWPPQQPADRAVTVLRVETVHALRGVLFACGHRSERADRCDECDEQRDRLDVVERVRIKGERVYVLAAHGGFADGEHVNRVSIDGSRPRAKVVCQRCKGERERGSENERR